MFSPGAKPANQQRPSEFNYGVGDQEKLRRMMEQPPTGASRSTAPPADHNYPWGFPQAGSADK